MARSRARLTTLQSAPAERRRPRARRRRSRMSVILFATLALALFLGGTFAAGYIVGKLLL